MGIEHIVEQGEHLARIAAEYGLSLLTLWEHPKNFSLKLKRDSPSLLLPGDVVHVPDKDEKTVDVATGHTYTIQVRSSRPRLRLKLRGLDGQVQAGTTCVLSLGDKDRDLTTDGSGLVEADLDPSIEAGTLTVGELEIALQIGFLDPIDTRSGLQGRLSNLGYYTGAVGDTDEDELRFALQLFQASNGLPVTGESDSSTVAKLKDIYGC